MVIKIAGLHYRFNFLDIKDNFVDLNVLQCFFSILKLHSERKLDVIKYNWWEANPDRVVCPEVVGDDRDGGISIYNIGQ